MINIAFCLIIYIVFFLVTTYKANYCKVTSKSAFLGRLNSLRGIFAIEIIIGHCVRYDSSILSPFGHFMLVSVGFFFFASGMGLTLSYESKNDYLDSFITNRFFKLIYIAIIALLFTTIIAYISPIKTAFTSIPNSLKAFVCAFFSRTNWYIRELLLLYLFFFIVFKLAKKHQGLIIFFSCVLISFVLYSLGYTRCWYASISCFPLGIIVCQQYDKTITFLNTLIGKVLIISSLVMGLLSPLLNNSISQYMNINFATSEFIFSVGNNFLCIGFILLLLLFLQYFNFTNPIMNFLSKYSTELFVFQFVFVEIAKKMQLSYIMKIAFVLLFDLLFSIAFHRIFQKYPFSNNHT